ncbi:sister chromatid cohesion and DNA repair protein [Niveomyces insectorum RCEF 264]|uniref:Protein-lysine N-methyltransferase EFM4 n=1 Tax=Niveomyces insectorum RCEF 264 TaxID=1081102 RepID=A0A167R9B7_9HYPO|nr:sister chromatid cohesion and DNA repair protein [Niveomyces insectorum RCEF 264]
MTPAPPQRPAHLAASELGTKEYWDRLYATELANHTSNPDDTGTVWFDDADAEAKMVQFLCKTWQVKYDSDDDDADNGNDYDDDDKVDNDDHGGANAHPQSPPPSPRTVLDLGCGNGALLRAVRRALFAGQRSVGGGADNHIHPLKPPRLLGVDYSEASIALARSIAEAEDAEESEVAQMAEVAEEGGSKNRGPRIPIQFAVWDVLRGAAADLVSPDAPSTAIDTGAGEGVATWDLILDKGTFDAISLGHAAPVGTPSEGGGDDGENNSNVENGDVNGVPSVEARYRSQVLRLLQPGGRFLITSCNWTEAELCAWMEGDDDDEKENGTQTSPPGEHARLEKVGRVAYPRFQFGGVQGQAVCTVCFAKRIRS